MPTSDAAPRYLEPLLGVVFDLDGTLIQSDHDFRRMRTEVIRLAVHHGVAPDRLRPDEPIPHLMDTARAELQSAGAPEGTLFRLEAEVNRAIDAIELEALPRVSARRGAAELLGALQARGFRLGLLTRSSETFCREALRRTDLDRYFDSLRTRSAPGPAKPSSDALLLLLEDPPRNGSLTVDRLQAAGASAVARTLEELGEMLGLAPSARGGTPSGDGGDSAPQR